MDSAEASGFPGWPVSVCTRPSGRYLSGRYLSGRYLSGLGASAVGLCAAGWLALTPYAFGYWDHAHHGAHDAALTDLATGGALAAVSLATMTCWAAAWRRRLRADGVLPATSRRQARRQARALRQHAHAAAAGGIPDPARVLADLRALLTALAADPVAEADGTSAGAATAAAAAAAGDWPGIPGPRTAPESGRMPRDCLPVPAGPGSSEAGAETALAGADADEGGPGRRAGLAAMESMLAGAELLLVGCGEEEEAW